MRPLINKIKVFIVSLILLFVGYLSGYFIIYDRTFQRSEYSLVTSQLEISSNELSNIQIIDLNKPVNETFNCIKTKTLVNHFSTIVCLYNKEKDIFVSGSFQGAGSIWEEGFVIRILQLLIRNPHLDFIDIGANIGTYTMYAAALGRFVLAIDCFEPNLRRIQRAIQLTNTHNRAVLIHNALYTESGKILRLSNEEKNIGGQEINTSQDHNKTNEIDPYLVRTIQFDELVPILKERGIRGAIMKVDIEGSESFVVQSGNKIFDEFDIPYVQMEWMKVRRIPDRAKVILDFFSARNYVPMTFNCQVLNETQISTWPDDFSWVKRNASNIC